MGLEERVMLPPELSSRLQSIHQRWKAERRCMQKANGKKHTGVSIELGSLPQGPVNC